MRTFEKINCRKDWCGTSPKSLAISSFEMNIHRERENRHTAHSTHLFPSQTYKSIYISSIHVRPLSALPLAVVYVINNNNNTVNIKSMEKSWGAHHICVSMFNVHMHVQDVYYKTCHYFEQIFTQNNISVNAWTACVRIRITSTYQPTPNAFKLNFRHWSEKIHQREWAACELMYPNVFVGVNVLYYICCSLGKATFTEKPKCRQRKKNRDE